MRKVLFVLAITVTFIAQAQPGKEAYRWHFGNKCKIDFTSGSPVVGIGPSLFFVSEGCAAVSDQNTGQYLFSVGATRVFNKNNVTMSNGSGLLGATNSTQSNLIVPKPDSSNIYYIITADYAGNLGNNGINYSVVDMSKQGGLGAVVLKNQPLIPSPTTERLAAIRHCNGKDYWIIAHQNNSDKFYVYPVTSNGIGAPNIIGIGTLQQYYGNTNFTYSGYLKASPDGKRIAMGVFSDSIPIVEVYDFDNLNGIISNPFSITYLQRRGPYGLTFSPDNSKLYTVPITRNYDTSFVFQYDLSSGVPSTIIASETLIAYRRMSVPSSWIGAMQIGPDGKIYIAWSVSDTLCVIHNPNNIGLACNFQYNGLIMPGGTQVNYGLPNFIDANYAGIQLNLSDIQLCNTFTTSVVDAGSGYSNYQWSTGATTQTISVSGPGQYWVTVTNDQGCTRTDTLGAYVIVGGKIDTVACDSFHANVTQSGVLQYNWYDADQNPVRDFTQSGQYWVDVSYVNGCGIRDSINLTVVPSPQIDIGLDTTFCKGNLPMNAYCNTCNYQWSTGQISPSISATTAGTYWVKVTDSNGCKDSDTLVIKPELNLFSFEMPNIVTPNNDNINDVIDFSKYQFSSLQIEIYNRWGQKIFESADANAIWKPTQEDGTYFYTAQYKIECGLDSKTKELKGYVTLIR